MKTITAITFLFFLCAGYAQDYKTEAKIKLEPLLEKFNAKQTELNTAKDILTTMTAKLDMASSDQLKKVRDLKQSLDSIYKQQEIIKSFYVLMGVSKGELDIYFPPQPEYKILDGSAIESEEKKAIYMLYDGNKIVEEKLFEGNKKMEDIFKSILSASSETCLGSFEIPGHRQKVVLYQKYEITPHYLYFEDIKFSIREGNIFEVKVRVTDEMGKNQFYFENSVPISLLSYNTYYGARRQYLSNRATSPLNVKDITNNTYNNFQIVLSDVLLYLSTPGNNFVPDDIEFSFPKETEDKTEPNRRQYKVIQNTSLQNILELRTYTDFLGLFDDSANGIVQVEGKADFFVTPFQVGRSTPLMFFKKVSPYVHYTRLDDDKKGLTLNDEVPQKIRKSLEIIEKSYLDMGSVLDVFSFRFKKETPFNINFFWALRYNITTIKQEEADDINFKTVGNGIGMRLEFKRFNNFGFTYSPEAIYYNHLNRLENIENPKNFWILRNEAEVFYFPGETKSQSIFLRLRTFLNMSDGEDSFFQLQFGYRFSIGMGSVKAKS